MSIWICWNLSGIVIWLGGFLTCLLILLLWQLIQFLAQSKMSLFIPGHTNRFAIKCLVARPLGWAKLCTLSKISSAALLERMVWLFRWRYHKIQFHLSYLFWVFSSVELYYVRPASVRGPLTVLRQVLLCSTRLAYW